MFSAAADPAGAGLPRGGGAVTWEFGASASWASAFAPSTSACCLARCSLYRCTCKPNNDLARLNELSSGCRARV